MQVSRSGDARVEAACRRSRSGDAQARNGFRGHRLDRGSAFAALRGITGATQQMTTEQEPRVGDTDQPDLPEYLTYDDDTTAYPAEAFAYVIGKSLGKLMKARGWCHEQWCHEQCG